MGNGPAGGGQGGTPNAYPGRGYAEYGTNDSYRDSVDWSGGARGPAALPSRVLVPNGPAPVDPRLARDAAPGTRSGWHSDTATRDGTGAQGPLAPLGVGTRRSPTIEDAGAPRLNFDNVFGHGTVPWSRPTYPNIAGQATYHAPTQMPSWSANAAPQVDRPTSAIPFSHKRIGSFTVRRPFGDNSAGIQFKTGSLADFVDGLPTGMNQQGRRWVSQSKTANPHLVNLTDYATAGSYGQTTQSLATLPSNPQATNPYGAY